jgi:hypothetical protein
VAVPQLVADLYETGNATFRLRLVGVLAGIGPAAREVVSTALIGLLVNQPDAALRDAAWAGLLSLGPACEAAGPEKGPAGEPWGRTSGGRRGSTGKG